MWNVNDWYNFICYNSYPFLDAIVDNLAIVAILLGMVLSGMVRRYVCR